MGEVAERLAQPLRPLRIGEQLDLGPDEVALGGEQVEVRKARAHRGVAQRYQALEHLVGGDAVPLPPQAGGAVRLRVEVESKHTLLEAASAAPRLITVVVLPTPPFWFATATTR